jgi:hypothetical protein
VQQLPFNAGEAAREATSRRSCRTNAAGSPAGAQCSAMGESLQFAGGDRGTPGSKPEARKKPSGLADASGSSRQIATLVTPASRPIVSAAVLLELARWCQQRLGITEDSVSCDHAQIKPQRPPFCTPREEAQEAGHSQLAKVGPQHPRGPARPLDPDDRAPRPKAVHKRRKGEAR